MTDKKWALELVKQFDDRSGPGRQFLTFDVFTYRNVQTVPEGGGWVPVKTLERHYYRFVCSKILTRSRPKNAR
jgi:hypothetical protein